MQNQRVCLFPERHWAQWAHLVILRRFKMYLVISRHDGVLDEVNLVLKHKPEGGHGTERAQRRGTAQVNTKSMCKMSPHRSIPLPLPLYPYLLPSHPSSLPPSLPHCHQ